MTVINFAKGGVIKFSKGDTSASNVMLRPTDLGYVRTGVVDVARIPFIPLGLKFAENLFYTSDVLRTVIRSIVWETFRNGIYIESAFQYKCMKCGTLYNEPIESCNVCGSREFRSPSQKQHERLEKWIKKANINEQTLIEILQDIDFDLNIFDNAYVIVRKEYYFDDDGKIVGAKPIEILRGDVHNIRLVISNDGRFGYTPDGNQLIMFCPNHRDKHNAISIDEYEKLNGSVRCPVCGKEMLLAYAEYGKHSRKIYLGPGEILHVKKFTHGIGYGYPMPLTLAMKLLILMKMDYYVLMSYHIQRPPKGILIMRANREAVAKAWQFLEEMNRVNPWSIAPLVIEGTEKLGSKRVAEWIDLSLKVDETTMMNYRDELRRSVGASYGVSPIFQGDMSTGGGLSVLPDTPIVIRRNKKWIDIIPIASLHKGGKRRIYKAGLSNIEVLSRNGWTEIISVIRQRKEKVGYRVITGDGFVEISEDHSIYLEDGREVKGSELKIGDKIMMIDMDRIERRGESESVFSEDFAYALGLFLAEGSAVKHESNGNVKYEVVIYNDDIEILERANRGIDAFFGVKGKINVYKGISSRTNRLIYANVDIYNWFRKYCYAVWKYVMGKETKVIYEKKVPIQILNADEKVKWAFINGYMDGDGYIADDGKEISFKGVYKTLIAGIKWLFNEFGYDTTVGFIKKASENRKNQIRVRIKKANKRIHAENEVKGMVEFVKYTDWYDISTVDGSFVGGVGLIVLHNSNQGLQITVTNRAVEQEQKIFNDKVLPWIVRQLGITDWVVKLKPHEEKDLKAQLEREMIRIQKAQQLVQLGYKVKLKDTPDGIDFEVEELDINVEFMLRLKEWLKENNIEMSDKDVVELIKLVQMLGGIAQVKMLLKDAIQKQQMQQVGQMLGMDVGAIQNTEVEPKERENEDVESGENRLNQLLSEIFGGSSSEKERFEGEPEGSGGRLFGQNRNLYEGQPEMNRENMSGMEGLKINRKERFEGQEEK